MEKRGKTGLIVFLIIFILISIGSCGYIIYDKFLVTNSNDSNITDVEDKNEDEQTQNNEVSEQKSTISDLEADNIIQATGFVGSSDILVYLKNNTLYEYHKEEDRTEKISDDVIRIYNDQDMIYAIKEFTDNVDLPESNVVTFLYEEDLTYSDGDKFSILYQSKASPSGFAGSGSHVLFLINNNLYYTNTNQNSLSLELVATGITRIENAGESIKASSSGNFTKYRDLSFVVYE